MDITSLVVSRRNASLLVGDYGSYREQLTRRLLTLRRHLGRTSSKGKKYVPKAPVTVEEISKNPEFVHLLVLSAERAWAHAMYMKSMHAADAGEKGITGSTRKHILSRLRRSVQIASQLVDLLHEASTTSISAATRLDALAYQSMLQGTLWFEGQHWERSLEMYSEARAAYSALIKISKAGQGEKFQELLSSVVEASLRYAAYQIRLSRTLSIQRIVARYARKDARIIQETLRIDPAALDSTQANNQQEQNSSAKDIPKNITWRQHTVPLEDAAIAQALGNAAAGQAALCEVLSDSTQDITARAAAYDLVLNPSQDAVDATTTALTELSAEGVLSGDSRMQALQITRTAVNYALVGWRIGRNRTLCGLDDGLQLGRFEVTKKQSKEMKKNSKLSERPVSSTDSNEDEVSPRHREIGKNRSLNRLRERVALYDSILQSLESVKSLPGVAADAQLLEELASRRAYFAALRCCNVAHGHTLLQSLPQALSLYSRALTLAKSVTPDDENQVEALNLEVSKEQANSLVSHLKGLTYQCRGLAQLGVLSRKTERDATSANTHTTWAEQLRDYPDSGRDIKVTKLVDYPPCMRPVPVKPIFLDLAWNHVDYPGQRRGALVVARSTEETRDETFLSEESTDERRGWFSSWRR